MKNETMKRRRQHDKILEELKSLSRLEALAGMARYRINT
jgi:hypothetical protein